MAIGINLQCEYCRDKPCNGKCGRDLEKEKKDREEYLKETPDYEEKKRILDDYINKFLKGK
jgi:hypothetical protein